MAKGHPDDAGLGIECNLDKGNKVFKEGAFEVRNYDSQEGIKEVTTPLRIVQQGPSVEIYPKGYGECNSNE